MRNPVDGRFHGLARHTLPISRPKDFRMGTGSADGRPGICHGLHLYGLPAVLRPGPGNPEGIHGLDRQGLLVSAGALPGGCHRDVVIGPISIRLHHGEKRIHGAVGLRSGGQPHFGVRSLEQL